MNKLKFGTMFTGAVLASALAGSAFAACEIDAVVADQYRGHNVVKLDVDGLIHQRRPRVLIEICGKVRHAHGRLHRNGEARLAVFLDRDIEDNLNANCQVKVIQLIDNRINTCDAEGLLNGLNLTFNPAVPAAPANGGGAGIDPDNGPADDGLIDN
jgi:hypothetical protein